MWSFKDKKLRPLPDGSKERKVYQEKQTSYTSKLRRYKISNAFIKVMPL